MKEYMPELIFLIVVIIVSVTGFWEIFFGLNADPNAFHYLHVVTSFIWLFLLLSQLIFIGRKNFAFHRKLGMSIFLMAPVLVATVALLSVHSAQRAALAGKEDTLLVQNVMVSFELGFFILMGFILRRNLKLHASFLLGTALLFMGIALFFSLISFVPQYKIEGPETFYRFANAGATGGLICAGVGVILFLIRKKNGWPWLLAPALLFLNEYINSLLTASGNLLPLTKFMGSFHPTTTFVVSFAVYFFLLSMEWQYNPGKRPRVRYR